MVLWLGFGVVMGLIGVVLRTVQGRLDRRPTSYATANRLLTSLRDVARQLPTGLDEVSLAQAALARLRGTIDIDRAALYSHTEAGALVPLAYAGADRIEWEASTSKGIWAQAWRGGIAVQRLGSFSRPVRGVSAVLPLRIGDRRTGLVAIERDGPAWTIREMTTAQAVVDEAALRINSGQLFSEVRALATVEERRRVAREIHDGIAQEVAALGFYVDDVIHRAQDPQLREDLQALRDELTRLVTELRLSIFDLRSDVQPGVGLGAALSSYVRSVGTGSGITVHLVLDEATTRLSPDTESELLRIAQEAVTNARKHAEARNLWVTCRVDPPRAFLRIADDGRGMGSSRPDSYGLEIMRERAARLGATLTIRPRVGGGTVVEVTLGPEVSARRLGDSDPTPVASTPG
jgi:signal transduction histidine kinase